MTDKLRIETHGNGPLQLAMIHGWAMTSDLFATIVEHFQSNATLHLIDLPGHGRSRDVTLPLQIEPVVDQLVHRLDEGTLWLGWSMGGLFAHAAARQGHGAGLVMLSSTPCFAQRDDWPHGIKPSVLANMRHALATDAHRTVLDFLQLEVLSVTRSHPSLETIKDEAFHHGLPTAAALEQGLNVLEASDIRPQVAELSIPNLWIGGSRDRLVAPSTLKEAAELSAFGESHVIDGAGHAAFISAPDALNGQLEQFAVKHGWI